MGETGWRQKYARVISQMTDEDFRVLADAMAKSGREAAEVAHKYGYIYEARRKMRFKPRVARAKTGAGE